ncbi:MAG: 16S rRNA (cytosine(1402)-N(4))-methyltransferase RsmH, partial [Gammaproteobacteria bacterium]
PLDMRMDPTSGISAAQWLATADEQDIADVLWRYGEERHSRRIARRIVETRTSRPLATTFELAALVSAAIGRGSGRIDPATRTFQGIRIRINDELGEIERLLDSALELLAVGGRLLVIAFHSLEDRIVKQRFHAHDMAHREAARRGILPTPTFAEVMRKPRMAGAAERAANPRARSARLRALERLA